MHRMSLSEVGEVARRAAASGAKVRGSGPTVHKVADALGLSHSDVQELLDQVRKSGAPVRDLKIVLAGVALVAAYMLGFGTTSLASHREAATSVAPETFSGSDWKGYAAPLPNSAGNTIVKTNASETPVASNIEPKVLDTQATSTTLDAKTTSGDVHRALEEARRNGTPVTRRSDQGTSGLMAAAEFAETNVR